MRSSPKYDTIVTEELINAICDLMDVEHHHHDLFDEPRYENDSGLGEGIPGCGDLKKAICVVYSSLTGPWQLAINFDGTISVPYDRKVAAEWTLKMFLPLRKKS